MMTVFREPTSGFTHLFAAIPSLIGTIWLVRLAWGDVGLVVAMLLYGFGTTFLFLSSGVYHLSHGTPERIRTLLRFDLVGIYLMIAGTYTPLVYYYLDGWWLVGILGTVWLMALLGSIYVLVFHHRLRAGRRWSLMFYILTGSVGVLAAPHFVRVVPPALTALLLLGGAIFLAGSVVFAIEKPNFHRWFNAHDLWHIFVLAGYGVFFVAILNFVALN